VQLRGARTILRDFRLDDADAAAAIIGDDRVTRWLSFDSRPHEAAVAMMERAVQVAEQDPRTEYYLGITTPEDDTVIGFVRLELTGHQGAKLGFAVHADHWRHGYASDAATTIIRFAFDTLGLHRITAAVGPENMASQSLIEKAGFTYEGRLRHHVFTNGVWRDSLLYSLLDGDVCDTLSQTTDDTRLGTRAGGAVGQSPNGVARVTWKEWELPAVFGAHVSLLDDRWYLPDVVPPRVGFVDLKVVVQGDNLNIEVRQVHIEGGLSSWSQLPSVADLMVSALAAFIGLDALNWSPSEVKALLDG
jgi:ribosomal-protein-alanine N-acetyltransferase